MRVSRERLLSTSEETGFRPEVLEKAIHLLNLLRAFRMDPFLKDRLALKGGTALNLFYFELPRLSVDIDLNYVGGPDREVMLAERPELERRVQGICAREDLAVARRATEHAGGKWLLRYDSASGGTGNLEIDLNFMFHVPLCPLSVQHSRPLGPYAAEDIQLVDIHELAAGKLVALLTRRQARDLFDARLLLTRGEFDRARLRSSFVVYAAMSRSDLRTVAAEAVKFDPVDLLNHLVPVLRDDFVVGLDNPVGWAEDLAEECRSALSVVLPLSAPEREFLDRLLDHGEIDPRLLTDDEQLAGRISRHPMLQWKALHVRRYLAR